MYVVFRFVTGLDGDGAGTLKHSRGISCKLLQFIFLVERTPCIYFN